MKSIKVKKGDLVKAIQMFLITIDLTKDILRGEHPAHVIKEEHLHSDNKYYIESECKICGHIEKQTCLWGMDKYKCVCGNDLNRNVFCNNNVITNCIKYSFRENAPCSDKIKLVIPVNNNGLKGAIVFESTFTFEWPKGKPMFYKFELMEDSPIIYFGVNCYRKFGFKSDRVFYNFINYYNSYMFEIKDELGNQTPITNLHDFEIFYKHTVQRNLYASRINKPAPTAPSKSYDCEEKRFACFDLKQKDETIESPFFLVWTVRTDLINQTSEYEAYCPHCKNLFTFSGTRHLYMIQNIICPNCGYEYEKNGDSIYFSSSSSEIYITHSNNTEIGMLDDDIVVVVRPINYSSKNCPKGKLRKESSDVKYIYTISCREEDEGQLTRYNLDKGSIIKAVKNAFTGVNDRVDAVNIISDDVRIKYTGVKDFTAGAEANVNNRSRFNLFEVIKYLHLAVKYPIIEKLAKAGYKNTVRSLINQDISNTDYVIEANTIWDFFSVPKYIFKVCNQLIKPKNPYCVVDSMRFFNKINDLSGVNTLQEENVNYILKYSLLNFLGNLVDIAQYTGLSLNDQLAYIERARVYQCISPIEASGLWKDYLRAADKIGVNVKDKAVKFPYSLKREHDIVAYKASLIEDSKKQQEFAEFVANNGKKYEWNIKEEKFFIKTPESLEELFEEGRVLNHCVGAYADSILSGQDMILFIRSKDAPNVPFYTVNVNPSTNTIVEIASYSNKKLSIREDTKLYEFLQRWEKRRALSGLKKCVNQ